MRDTQAIAFDLEATGLPSNRTGFDRVGIVQIGAVTASPTATLCYNGATRKLASFTALTDPKISICAGASRVNHLFDDDVAGKPPLDLVFADFVAWSDSQKPTADTVQIMVTYGGLHFDFPLLKARLHDHDISLPRGWILVDLYQIFLALGNEHAFGVGAARLISHWPRHDCHPSFWGVPRRKLDMATVAGYLVGTPSVAHEAVADSVVALDLWNWCLRNPVRMNTLLKGVVHDGDEHVRPNQEIIGILSSAMSAASSSSCR
jgi:DNA polymerase III epsilon subunit-like protein